MELISITRILRRWFWVIVSIVALAVLALLLVLLFSKPKYEGQAKLQFSTPEQASVSIYTEQYRSINPRDEITVARNNFVSILGSDEIRNRTLQALNLDPIKTKFTLETKSDNDSDFLYVTVRAPSAQLAASITNTIIDQAIKYYGELRAKPSLDEKNLYAAQLKTAEDDYNTAADSFTSFKTENNVVDLPQEILTAQRLLEQLQSQRDIRVSESSVKDTVSQINELITLRQKELDRLLALQPMYAILEANYNEALQQYRLTLTPLLAGQRKAAEEKFRSAEKAFNEYKAQNNISSLQDEITLNNDLLKALQTSLDQRKLDDSTRDVVISQIDELIVQRKKELDRLSALQSTYNVREEKVNEAQANYQHILSKYTEADLTATVLRAAKFIQVIEPAQAPIKPINNWVQLLVLGVLGSLGLGVILAFLLDYLTGKGEDKVLRELPDSRSI